MIFPTVEFAAFFVVVLAGSWLLMPHPRAWKPFILLASLFFYGYADPRFVVLIVASILLNQGAATLIAGTTSQPMKTSVLTTAVVLNLGLLGLFKYLNFFVESVDQMLIRIGLPTDLPILEIALPIGISFFTFQAISYVVDVRQGVFPRAGWLDFAVYLSFFPHLVAGPIVRAREFIPQLASPRSPRDLPAAPALFLIAGGLIKKVVIADLLTTRLVDPVFGSPDARSALETLLGIYGYAAQIYCDFSGYTDIAIGLAMLLGFRFPQNFDRPYTAASLQDFWRRWHMTLSRWLRDYLYIPLGGSRKGAVRTYVNLMITMLLGGLWHGASWTFVIWGAIHGTGLCLERWAVGRRRIRLANAAAANRTAPAPTPVALGVLAAAGGNRKVILRRPGTPVARTAMGWPVSVGVFFTFQVVCLAWVFFRSPDLEVAQAVLSRLVDGWGVSSTLITPTVLVLLVVGLGTQWVPPSIWRECERRFAALPLLAQGVLLGAVLVLLDAIVGQQGVAPFIYFRF